MKVPSWMRDLPGWAKWWAFSLAAAGVATSGLRATAVPDLQAYRHLLFYLTVACFLLAGLAFALGLIAVVYPVRWRLLGGILVRAWSQIVRVRLRSPFYLASPKNVSFASKILSDTIQAQQTAETPTSPLTKVAQYLISVLEPGEIEKTIARARAERKRKTGAFVRMPPHKVIGALRKRDPNLNHLILSMLSEEDLDILESELGLRDHGIQEPPGFTPAPPIEVEIVQDLGQNYAHFLPAVVDGCGAMVLHSDLEGLKISNNGTRVTTIEGDDIWLEVLGCTPLEKPDSKLDGPTQVAAGEKGNYRLYYRQAFRDWIEPSERQRRLRLCVKATGHGTFRMKLPDQCFFHQQESDPDS